MKNLMYKVTTLFYFFIAGTILNGNEYDKHGIGIEYGVSPYGEINRYYYDYKFTEELKIHFGEFYYTKSGVNYQYLNEGVDYKFWHPVELIEFHLTIELIVQNHNLTENAPPETLWATPSIYLNLSDIDTLVIKLPNLIEENYLVGYYRRF